MPRRRKCRFVEGMPEVSYFKPQGSPIYGLEEIVLTVDEYETLRIADVLGMNQTEGASKMGIHQSNFQRTLSKARGKVASAIVNGHAIKIEGGEFEMPRGDGTGPEGRGPMTGRGIGSCAGAQSQGFARSGCGKGRGRGMGRCRGFSDAQVNEYQPSKEEEIKMLENEKNAIEKRLDAISKKIEELKE